MDATNWTESTGSNAEINTNRLRFAGTTTTPGVVRTTTSAHAAVADCQASITRIAGTSFDGGPVVRASGDTTFYGLDVYGSNTLEVYRHNGSTSGTLLAGRTQTHANGDVYKLYVSGTGATVTLRIYRNGVQVGADITDTSGSRLTAAAQTGVYNWATGNQDFDDFLVEDLGGAATKTPPIFRRKRFFSSRRAA